MMCRRAAQLLQACSAIMPATGSAKVRHRAKPFGPGQGGEGGGMKGVDLYARVRRAVYVEGISQRGAARYFGIAPRTVAKMMRFSVPPGYRRSRPPARPSSTRSPGSSIRSWTTMAR